MKHMLLLLGSLAALAQPQVGGVKGTVSSPDSPRIVGAILTLTELKGTKEHSVTSGADGGYEFKDVPVGNYRLSVRYPGHVADHRFGQPLWNIPGGIVETENLRLVRAGAISGRVTDANGDPVENMPVEMERNGVVKKTASTDDRGEYRLAGLLPGKYRVRAMPRHNRAAVEIRTDGTREQMPVPTYHPSWVNVLPGGDLPAVDIRLEQMPVVSVRGAILDMPADVPVTNFSLALALAQGAQRQRVLYGQVAADGTFRIERVPPGTYSLVANYARSGVFWTSIPTEVVVGGSDVTGLTMRLLPGQEIRGSIEWDDRTKALREKPMQVFLESVGAVKLQPDSTFVFRSVRPGLLGVFVFETGTEFTDAFVKAMRLKNGTRIEGCELPVTGVGDGEVITLVLSGKMAQVSGTVRNHRGDTPDTVMLVSDSCGYARHMTTTDSAGRFEVRRLRPGKYTISVIDPRDWADILQTNRLEDYQAVAQTIELGEGESTVLELTAPE